MVVKRQWVTALSGLYETLSRTGRRPLVCTGFNARNHAAAETGDGYRIKPTVGGANLLFDKDTYRDIVRPTLLNVAWDWRLCEHVSSWGNSTRVALWPAFGRNT